jgi:hypothetical protein
VGTQTHKIRIILVEILGMFINCVQGDKIDLHTFIMAMYCCIRNYSKTEWLKTFVFTHKSIAWGGLAEDSLSLLHITSAKLACLSLEDVFPKCPTRMAGELVLS